MANETFLSHLIDPQVLADMISADLPYALRFRGVAPLDFTLVNQPGSTITLPKYGYIGDAVVVPEYGAIPYSELTTTKADYTVKKMGKGVILSDEAVLSGYGDPVGEAVAQIVDSIASAIDAETLDEINTTSLTATATGFGAPLVEAIETMFSDENGDTGVIFMHTKDAIKHRTAMADNWTRASELGDNLLIKGAFGETLGWLIVRSNRVPEGSPVAVKQGALKTFLKRDTFAERDRDIDHKLTKYNADKHFVVALVDESKAIKVTVNP